MPSLRKIFVFVLVATLSACAQDADETMSPDLADNGAKTFGDLVSGPDLVCSTAPMLPLSQQLADAALCAAPDILWRFNPESMPGVSFGQTTLPVLERSAWNDLVFAANNIFQNGGPTIEVTSVFRSLPMQFLLNANQDHCASILTAVEATKSLHERGQAIDIEFGPGDKSIAIDWLRSYGWTRPIPDEDSVHFEHLESDYIPDDASFETLSVVSFQTLWTANHPNDPLTIDGVLGARSETKLKQAPIDGFNLTVCDDAFFDAKERPPNEELDTDE